jgi:PhnB protein
MARVSTYLNFQGNTEDAFNFYKSVFGTEFEGEGIMRMGDIPAGEGTPPAPEHEKNLVMHVSLPILAGHLLMGTDLPESMGKLVQGNNVNINLEPDTRAEVDALFAALSTGGQVEVAPTVMFWGDYYGACTDKFGVKWMFNCANKEV